MEKGQYRETLHKLPSALFNGSLACSLGWDCPSDDDGDGAAVDYIRALFDCTSQFIFTYRICSVGQVVVVVHREVHWLCRS